MVCGGDACATPLPSPAGVDDEEGEEEYDEAVPSNVRECVVAGHDKVTRALNIVRQRINEGPNDVALTHDDGSDLACAEILVRRFAHFQVFLEQHCL